MYYRPDSLLDLWRPFALSIPPSYIRCTYVPPSSSYSSASSRFVCPQYTYKVRDSCAYFEIEIPGVEKKDISVETRGRKIDIRAKRYKTEISCTTLTACTTCVEEDKRKVHVEYRFVAELGPKAHVEKVKADYQGLGVLRLFVPLKTEESHKIEIHS